MIGPDRAHLSQRAIYDKRYEDGQYDHRSAVHVLTAERETLNGALRRVLASHPDAATISLFDFGHGTGRVTNELIKSYASRCATPRKNLLVVAYDVSSVGLKKSQEDLRSAGFQPMERQVWEPEDTSKYIVGSVHKEEAGVSITVIFLHGSEDNPPQAMSQLAIAANRGDRYLITTSWYSGLGHIPGENLRRDYFRQLDEITCPGGEIVLTVSGTGDLPELQEKWADKLAKRETAGFPIEVPGDVIYDTELKQQNFYHVFSTDLNEHMQAITTRDQHWWIEGIRCPDEEFDSQEAEQANYRRVREANRSNCQRLWNVHDYREFHSVAALRSGMKT
jgi:hypothetical protein